MAQKVEIVIIEVKFVVRRKTRENFKFRCKFSSHRTRCTHFLAAVEKCAFLSSGSTHLHDKIVTSVHTFTHLESDEFSPNKKCGASGPFSQEFLSWLRDNDLYVGGRIAGAM